MSEYHNSMLRAALGYLIRHEAQYEHDSDQLYRNCVHYLVNTLKVPLFLAQQWVHHAWCDLHVVRRRQWLGIDWGTHAQSQVVHLVDTRTDTRYPIAARLLPSKLLEQREAMHPGVQKIT